MRKNIYIISGLGADDRVFANLNLSSFNLVYLPQAPPIAGESIEQYSLRLTSKIVHDNPIIIGLSFGGMIAIEISKHIKTEALILISSFKNVNEIPFYFRFAGYIGIHKFIPFSMLNKSPFIINWLFGLKTYAEQMLLADILNNTDIKYLRWAITQIVNWKSVKVIDNLTHIHGDSDKLIPFKLVKNARIIKTGGHFMIYNKAQEISDIIIEILGKDI